MAVLMPGPAPKPAHLRQRTNKTPGRAKLPSAERSLQNEVPPLPARSEGDWHPMVREWWVSVWQSPMASQYLEADMKGGLLMLAELHQIRWTASNRDVIAAAAEIRRQEIRFGLSPIDRRRLQWEVERDDDASDEQEKQEEQPTRRVVSRPKLVAKSDPRSVLKVGSTAGSWAS